MSIFKNVDTNKCLSMGHFGPSINGSDIILDDCSHPMFEPTYLDKSSTGNYQIKHDDKCLIPSLEKTPNGKTKVAFDTSGCNDSNSYFRIYEEDTSDMDAVKDEIDIYLLYANNMAFLDGEINIKDMLVTAAGHEFASDTSFVTVYYKMYDIEGDITNNKLLYTSTTIKCRLKYIVEEHKINGTIKQTIYYIVPDSNFIMTKDSTGQTIGGLIFKDVPKSGKDWIQINTTVDSTYRNNSIGRQGIQKINNNIIQFGLLYNGTFYPASVNTSTYPTGFSLTSGTTDFKLVLKRTVDQYKFLYQYNRLTNKESHKTGISSYINPRKKMAYINNTNIKSFNTHDHTRRWKFNFSINPVEGFTNEGNNTYLIFGDGSNSMTTPEYIEYIFNLIGEEPEPGTSMNDKFDQMIGVLSSSIINLSHSQKGNEKYHSWETVNNLKRLKGLIIKLKNYYGITKDMFNTMENSIKYLPLCNLYNGSSCQSNKIEFDFTKFTENINNIEYLLSLLNRFVIDINITSEERAPDFTFEKISVNISFLHYMAKIINYFTVNYDNIDKYVNNFYDYLGASNNSSFKIYDNFTFRPIINNYEGNIYNGVIGLIDKTLFNDGFQYNGQETIKTFIDIDFGNIYNFIYGPIQNPPIDINYTNKIFEPSISNLPSITGNSLINEHYKWLQSQEKYIIQYNKFTHLIRLANKIINYDTNNINDFKAILLDYYDTLCQPFLRQFTSYFSDNAPTSSMTFFKIITSYVSRMRSATDVVLKARLFVFCYSNIKFAMTNIDVDLYTDLNMLYKYYETSSYFIKKYNEILIENFSLKFKLLALNALGESNLLELYKNILDLNDPELYTKLMEISQKSEDDASLIEGFSNKEGMLSGTFINVDAQNLFPLNPTYLNTNDVYQNNSLKILEDGYKYKETDDKIYDTFSAYIDDTISGGSVDFTNDTVFTCKTVAGGDYSPTISMEFYCGSVQQPLYNGIYDKNIFNKKCGQDSCIIDTELTLKLEENAEENATYSTLKLILTDISLGNSSEIILVDNLPPHELLETFGFNSEKTKLITQTKNKTIELLTIMDNGSNVSSLGGVQCLMDADGFIRLFIDRDGILSFQYKHKIKKPINDPPSNIKIVPNYAIKQPANGYSYTTLYDLTPSDKNKLGDNLKNIHGYIGYDGVYHQANDLVGDDYKEYKNFCFNTSINTDVISLTDCNDDKQCIGLLEEAPNGNYKKITEENKKYLYECGSTNDRAVPYKHKKLHLNTNNLACIRNSKNSQIIDYDAYDIMSKGTEFKPEDCGLNKLLNPNRNLLETTRTNFTSKFENLLTTYNALSENELRILTETDIKVNELTNMLEEYQDLIKKSSSRVNILNTSKIQKKDSSKLYTQMEYKNAFFGIMALIGGIGCLHYMKNK